jgi:Spy/CpxP family protein refolding chaperone
MNPVKQLLPAAFLALVMISVPAFAADMQDTKPMHGKMKPMNEGDMMERHIAHLHDMLKVGADQEEQWKSVAQTMRDNETALHDLIKSKQAMIATQSAVDDLNSYAEIADLHAQGAKKMAAAFATFYAGLTDSQKKTADEFFHEHKHHNGATSHGPASKHQDH